MLRTIVLALATVVTVGAGAQSAQAQEAGTLTIEFAGLAPQGALMIQVFDSEAAYRAGTGVASTRAEVSADTARVEFTGLPPGQYAFRLYHDLNGDGRMNTNPFGMPTEPYAFSNNARGSFGPASWSDAVFTLNAGANVQRIEVGGPF